MTFLRVPQLPGKTQIKCLFVLIEDRIGGAIEETLTRTGSLPVSMGVERRKSWNQTGIGCSAAGSRRRKEYLSHRAPGAEEVCRFWIIGRQFNVQCPAHLCQSDEQRGSQNQIADTGTETDQGGVRLSAQERRK